MAKHNNNNNKGKGNNPKTREERNSRGRGYRKPKEQKINEGREKMEPGDINNPAYYYEDANVLSQVMNFSFNEFGGVPIDITMNAAGAKRTTTNPMIASYWLNPSIPQSSSGSQFTMDGATTAALRNYLALSGSNAKTTSYAPQDVAILTLAVAELIKVSTFIARAFGVAYLFNYRNRSYPETLLRAMGIDAQDFGQHLAEYRVRFNKLLSVAAKIPFPADIPLFRKAADLYGSMYLDDENSALAQTYFFNPYSVWLFDEAYDTNGAGLRTTILVNPSVPQTMSIILNVFESMITQLVNSTSLNAIYSDILRLVQNGKLNQLITFNSIPEDFVVVPVYNAEVESWIHNAVIMGEPLPAAQQYSDYTMDPLTPSNDLSCDANSNKLFYHPQFKLNVDAGFSALLDFDHDAVTVDEKVRATRLSTRYTTIEDTGNAQFYTRDLAMIDEYIVCYSIFDGTTNSPATVEYANFHDANNLAVVLSLDFMLSKFDWAPIQYWIYGTGILPFGDLDYYTVVDYNVLKRIYDYEIIHLLQIG